MYTNPSWKEYFTFSKKDRRVVIGLLIVFIPLLLWLAFYNAKPEPPAIENLDEMLAKLSSQKDDNTNPPQYAPADNKPISSTDQSLISLFYFDPNTLDESGFKKLGLRDKTIHTLINYRNKGGHFYKPEDLRKIYGLMPEEAERLIPFVKINSSKQISSSFTTNNEAYDSHSTFPKKKPEIIDINTATVEQWKALPAIGDALSNRIVKYRDKMAGFRSVEQVRQTYGLSDSAYTVILPYLRLSSTNQGAESSSTSTTSSKININKATVNELKSNPAISGDVAEAIVIYRKQHGNYASVADIKKIVFINEEVFQKIAPLLTTE